MITISRILYLLCTIMVLVSPISWADPVSRAAPDAEVSIIQPKDGDTVNSPVKVVFGVKGMTVMPAGIAHPRSGHHHLLVDVKDLPDLSQPIPSDSQHLHFGKGQKETVLELSPGVHTLQLLLGDHLHRPHDKPVLSEKISITVKESKKGE